MKRTRRKVGPISVYLTREQINALLYLLDCFPAADADNKLAADAEKLKRKIMLHGRTFNDRGEEKVSLYFYEEEASTLILLTSVFVLAFGNSTNDYYAQIGLTRKGVGISHDAEQEHSTG